MWLAHAQVKKIVELLSVITAKKATIVVYVLFKDYCGRWRKHRRATFTETTLPKRTIRFFSEAYIVMELLKQYSLTLVWLSNR